MSDKTIFESRKGNVNCSREELFNFASDIRNFERFIPEGSVSEIAIEKYSCSFRVSMLGTVSIKISEAEKFSKVVYSGNAMQINDFLLVLNIMGKSDTESEAIVTLTAELNPFLKMIAAEPARQFLDTLINEMEKYRGWKDII